VHDILIDFPNFPLSLHTVHNVSLLSCKEICGLSLIKVLQLINGVSELIFIASKIIRAAMPAYKLHFVRKSV